MYGGLAAPSLGPGGLTVKSARTGTPGGWGEGRMG